MRNRFKQNSPDFKENLLSPNTVASDAKKTFFDNPTVENKKNPLSPSRQNNVMSPTKKFFPEMKSEDPVEPVPPKRTTSRMGDKDFKYSASQHKNVEKTPSSDIPAEKSQLASHVQNPEKKINSPVKQVNNQSSPVNDLSQGSPVKRVQSTKRPDSPLKRVDSMNRSPVRKHEPVKITSSFRSRGSPSTENSPKKTTAAPSSSGGGLRTMPSIRVKPSKFVSLII